MIPNKNKTLAIIFISALLFGCGNTEETIVEEKIVIDFSPPTLPNGSRCENSPFERENYIFTPISNCAFVINNIDGTGNTYLQVLSNGLGSSITAPNNTTFTIYQIDIAEYSTVFNSQQITQLTCIKNGLPVYIQINLDGIITNSNDMFETFYLEDQCSDITKLLFDPIVSVDNILISKI